MSNTPFENMIGLTMSSVVADRGNDVMTFTSECGKVFKFLHHQDCCENVGIEDICGDLDDLVGSPLYDAEECSNLDNAPTSGTDEENREGTWTFYRFATRKGSVTVRWFGSSNGYYSEGVSYEEEL
jgi:hypothetical protein